ncbi:MAG TPA: hypothetical protein VH744_04520 [Terriglobales bacterium]|jgi:hypothetical protein
MVRLGSLLSIPLVACALLPAATLEQLSLDDMVWQSSAIVRAKAGQSRSIRNGALIYTLVEVEVLDQWKGERVARREIALPGGRVGALRQHFGGVPLLTPGQEFVAFLWTGASGRTQILGLSQGLFDVIRDAQGRILVRRKPTGDLMLTPGSATPTPYLEIEMPLEALVAKILSATAAGGTSTQ